MKIWPNILKCAKLGSQFCPIQNKPSNNSQRVLKFCQSGEISPNLVGSKNGVQNFATLWHFSIIWTNQPRHGINVAKF